MTDPQSDARLAYIAYRSVAGEPFPEWDELGDELQASFGILAATMNDRAAAHNGA